MKIYVTSAQLERLKALLTDTLTRYPNDDFMKEIQDVLNEATCLYELRADSEIIEALQEMIK